MLNKAKKNNLKFIFPKWMHILEGCPNIFDVEYLPNA